MKLASEAFALEQGKRLLTWSLKIDFSQHSHLSIKVRKVTYSNCGKNLRIIRKPFYPKEIDTQQTDAEV
jgi:hypothetical protein